MSIKVYCVLCGEELTEPGALLFGPPSREYIGNDAEGDVCAKDHLCVSCYADVLKSLPKEEKP